MVVCAPMASALTLPSWSAGLLLPVPACRREEPGGPSGGPNARFPYLASMKPYLLPAVLLASFLFSGCKEKENTPGLCITTPTPRVELISWPSGLSVDSTWTVPRSSILLYASAVADQASSPSAARLTTVNTRIVVQGNDSLLYARNYYPQSPGTYFEDTASIGAISANVLARLSITANNECGYSDAAVRKLRITP